MTPLLVGNTHWMSIGEEPALIAGLIAGEEQAFRTVVQHYGPLLASAPRRIVVDPKGAEDVLAETWTAVFRGIEGFSGVEVARILDLSEANERVLVHRARGTLRQALDEYVSAGRDE